MNINTITNRTDDIEGAHPLLKEYQYTNRQDLYNVNDIDGAQPRKLTKELNESFLLRTNDIEFAQPRCVEFRTNRHINPIDPEYKLPSYTTAPIPKPKFIRDQIDISDIEGTRPGKLYPYEKRDIINVVLLYFYLE